MGDFFRRGLGRRELVVATAFSVLATAPLGRRRLILGAAAGLALLARACLGGLTGDVYGAIIELAELAALTAGCLVE